MLQSLQQEDDNYVLNREVRIKTMILGHRHHDLIGKMLEKESMGVTIVDSFEDLSLEVRHEIIHAVNVLTWF